MQGELQDIAAVCLWIASKYEEIVPPTVYDFSTVAASGEKALKKLELLAS